jgi:hypothetical protein
MAMQMAWKIAGLARVCGSEPKNRADGKDKEAKPKRQTLLRLGSSMAKKRVMGQHCKFG